MHCWLDSDGGPYAEASILVEEINGRIKVVLLAPGEHYPKRHNGDFCLDDPIGIAIGRSVIRGDCPAGVFADWLEEHPDRPQKVFDGSDPVDGCVQKTIRWLRRMTTHSFVGDT